LYSNHRKKSQTSNIPAQLCKDMAFEKLPKKLILPGQCI